MVDKVWVEDDSERVVGRAGWAQQGSQGGQVGNEQRSEIEGTFCELIIVIMTIAFCGVTSSSMFIIVIMTISTITIKGSASSISLRSS